MNKTGQLSAVHKVLIKSTLSADNIHCAICEDECVITFVYTPSPMVCLFFQTQSRILSQYRRQM